MHDFLGLLQSEMKPALGVTEVGAIALCAARAYDAVGGTIIHIHIKMNGGMYKNAYACGIPSTEERGGEMAALLGALGGDWRLGLECLKHMTPDLVVRAKGMDIPVMLEVAQGKAGIYLEGEITTTKGVGIARIAHTHSNFVFVAKDDTVLWEEKEEAAVNETAFDFDTVTIGEMVSFATTVPLGDILFLKEMIEMNCRLSQEGEQGVGLAVGKTLASFGEKGLLGQDMIFCAQTLTCSAMDARLAGIPFPAMSIVGSGSHGILCSLPVVSYGRTVGAREEEVLRALALSCLITIYSKHYTGRLSPLCGCVLGGGGGAACGIVLLMGGGTEEVAAAMDHMAANLTGMICDGGNTGCTLKASAGVYTAFLCAMLAIEGRKMPKNFGVVGSSGEQTVKNLAQISAQGMAPMDETILNIMKAGK